MKRLMQVICAVFLLCGCDGANEHQQQQDLLEQLQTQGNSTLTFVIAGSLGPSEEVIRRSNLRWKLSDLTFTHQMTRLLVLEQIYRAYMIRHHRPYHK